MDTENSDVRGVYRTTHVETAGESDTNLRRKIHEHVEEHVAELGDAVLNFSIDCNKKKEYPPGTVSTTVILSKPV